MGPKGVDPTALVRNAYSAPIYWYWYDGSTGAGGDTIPAHTTRCERFLAQPDSARYDIIRSDTLTQVSGWNHYTSNWFNPSARDFWTVDATGPSPNLIVKDTTAAPC
jgi:hypothetical protein